MTKISLSESDLQDQFKEQLNFIEKSAKAYDEGDFTEAKRMAVALRILLHKTAASTSLLYSLGLQDITNFQSSSSQYDPGLFPCYHTLVTVGMLEHKYYPLFTVSNVFSFQSYGSFWNEEIIFSDNTGNKFTRKDLVCYLADQDGGAHVDPKIDKAYYELSRGNSLGWKFKDGEKEGELTGAEHAAVRQIAHEVLTTFRGDLYKPDTMPKDIHIFGIGAHAREKEVSKVGRNESCPCGKIKQNGKRVKYKYCHGV